MHTATQVDIITQFRDLVWYTVKKFMRPGLEKDDLAQEGYCGLLRAFDKFDPDRGVSFLTYAYPWVYAAMQTHAENFVSPMCMSHSFCTKQRQKDKLEDRATQFLDYPRYGDNNDPFEDMLKDEEKSEEMDRMVDSKTVYEAIMYLPLAHQRVLLSYFFEGKNLSSLTTELAVTKQRVHQIYKEAIVLLRKRLHVRVTQV